MCVCRLMLQFDISDVTREGVGVSCQLMVGQSSVPHYQQLEEFTARLAPGEVSVQYAQTMFPYISPARYTAGVFSYPISRFLLEFSR